LPDWRRAADYRFPRGFPSNRWAWEFLRRNPDYRRDWAAALDRFRSGTGEFEGWTEGARSDDPENPEFYLWVDEKDKWRIGALLNPDVDEPNHLGFTRGFGRLHVMREGVTLKARGPAYPIIVFDLHYPLKPQFEAHLPGLERARKVFKIHPPKQHRHHRKLWPSYLRLLDADLDGRTPKQIADVLQYEDDGMTEGKVWDRLQTAKKMTRPEGYMSLFLSTEKSGT
jgi:transcriptional regulator